MKYILPEKRKELSKDYSILEKNISEVIKYLDKQNVLQAKVALGKVYMDLCEIKPVIEESFYESIQNARFRLENELKPSFFGNYSKEKIKTVCEDFKQIKNNIKEKLKDLCE